MNLIEKLEQQVLTLDYLANRLNKLVFRMKGDDVKHLTVVMELQEISSGLAQNWLELDEEISNLESET